MTSEKTEFEWSHIRSRVRYKTDFGRQKYIKLYCTNEKCAERRVKNGGHVRGAIGAGCR